MMRTKIEPETMVLQHLDVAFFHKGCGKCEYTNLICLCAHSSHGDTMPKNITLSVSDEVANQMDTMPEVNWSAVARTCIMQYIEVRKNPDISSLLEKLQKQKGEEYMSGRRKADDIANDLGYSGLNLLMKKYSKKMDEVTEQEITGAELLPWETLPSPEGIIQALLSENKLINNDVSDAFLKGLKERLLEIEKALSK